MGAEDAIDLIDPRSRIFGDHIQRRLIDRARVQGSELRGFTGVQSPESRILSPDSDSRVQSPESRVQSPESRVNLLLSNFQRASEEVKLHSWRSCCLSEEYMP